VRILSNCRAAMRPGARVLVVESIIPPGNEPNFGKALDLLMLLLLPGQERTLPEFERVFSRAGLVVTRILPTPGALSLIEAEIAP
jgi:hypothetical protein